MSEVYINIGSNLGDRLHYINAAVAAIESRLNTTARRSDTVYSDPWGYQSPNTYANIGILLHTTMAPLPLLDLLLDIEHCIGHGSPHRLPDGSYADRTVDIDLIAIDTITLSTPRLTLPHPRMLLRPFVLIPMVQLWPHWRHPRTHLTPSQSLALLKP